MISSQGILLFLIALCGSVNSFNVPKGFTYLGTLKEEMYSRSTKGLTNYFLSSEAVDWGTAFIRCPESLLKGKLLAIRTEAEMTLVINGIHWNIPLPATVWTSGIHDGTNWVWATQEELSIPPQLWDAGFPNSDYGYVILNVSEPLNSQQKLRTTNNSQHRFKFICEDFRDNIPTTTTSTSATTPNTTTSTGKPDLNPPAEDFLKRRVIPIIGGIGGLFVICVATALCLGFQNKKLLNQLSDRDKELFYNGDQDVFERFEDGLIKAYYSAYNKKKLEISHKRLHFDKKITPKKGGFGIVSRAVLKTSKDKKIAGIEVAVKKRKDPKDVEQLKGLACELKILSYIGYHENVIKLVGAVTSGCKDGPYLVLEYCNFGSLDAFLRDHRDKFCESIKVSASSSTTVGRYGYTKLQDIIDDTIQMKDLLKWGAQIASGMEYIETKKIVHGDLFAKNIVLAKDWSARITDFGLSMTLSDYPKSYVFLANGAITPLPQFLAPETKLRKFSPQSDVWTFGILLWEIFTLGDEPNCTENANQLQKPELSNEEIFETIQKCWIYEPDQRITFTLLKEYFQGLLTAQSLLCNIS